MASKIVAEVSPRNGSCPVAISYKTGPKENKSVRTSSFLARACAPPYRRRCPTYCPGWLDVPGHFLRGQCFPIARRVFWETLCKAKVENLGIATFGNEDIRRLDVAVGDSLP